MKNIMLSLLLLSVLCLSGCGFTVVDTGTTGVKKVMGKVDPEPKPPGVYFYNPLTTDITEMDNRVQKKEGSEEVYTKDVQQVTVNYAVNYELSAESSVRIYSTVGRNYDAVLIPQIINGGMKNIIGKWDAIELVANRSKASTDIEQMLTESLKPYGITVSGFQLTNIKFTPAFEQAVEAKVAAVQQADQAKNQTVQVAEQAKQRIITAQADAQAMQIQTAALKESQSLVLYEAVKKWDGHTPSIVTVGAGAGNLLNIPEDLLKAATKQ